MSCDDYQKVFDRLGFNLFELPIDIEVYVDRNRLIDAFCYLRSIAWEHGWEAGVDHGRTQGRVSSLMPFLTDTPNGHTVMMLPGPEKN